jgi:oligopeptide/dipeptide ABC transporter ATP-binding protein
MQIIFQDPYSSLNPRYTVSEIVGEAMRLHGLARGRSDAKDQVGSLLERVGLSRDMANRYPHEFSGGQRQRIGIARALAVRPEFIVCDEAVSALDVSIQAQILDLLNDLKDEFEMAVLLITHDLGVVAEVADRVVVMYAGKIAETADVVDLFEHPLHPYTKALFRSLPSLESRKETLEVIPGSVPSPLAFPSGCRFRTRCQISRPECATFDPELLELRPGHFVACPFTSDTGRSAEAGR